MSFFEVYQRLAPRWLTDGDGGTVLASLALMADDYAARAKLGLLARFPQYAPDDTSLGALGRDRRIVRGIGESATAYSARLVRALDDLATRGNPYALLGQVQAFLGQPCVVRTVDRRGNWYRLAADGTKSSSIGLADWTWDAVPASPFWGRFWLIIEPVGGTLPWAEVDAWGDATLWGSGVFGAASTTIGTTATPAEVGALRSIVREWKPAGVACEWIVVSYNAAAFGPGTGTVTDALWGDWSKTVSGVRVESRSADARYWRGADGA